MQTPTCIANIDSIHEEEKPKRLSMVRVNSPIPLAIPTQER